MNKIIKAFKHTFIPHEHNDYKPHFFRELSMLSITIVAIVLLCISASSVLYIKNNNLTATVLPAVLVDLTNNARTADSKQVLTRNPVLDAAASLKAHDMAANGYFAHTSPAGISPWYWFDKAGYYFAYAGENLAINFSESIDVEDAWLKSPGHRANILNDHFTEIGIATIDGMYQGSPTTYVVQMFGAPAIASAAETETEVEVTPTSLPTTTPAPAPKPTPIKNPIVPKPKPSPTTVASAPGVKGDSKVPKNNLETITDTKEFVAVKNVSAAEPTEVPLKPAHYSTWQERLLFLMPSYTDRIYHAFIWILTIALLFMIIFEVRRQHAKNIAYGVLLLVIMICLIYINKTVFVTSFLA